MFPQEVQKFINTFPGGEQYELEFKKESVIYDGMDKHQVKAGERVFAYKLQRPDTEIWYSTRAGTIPYKPTHVGVLVVGYEASKRNKHTNEICVAVNVKNSRGHELTPSVYFHDSRTVYVKNYYLTVTGYQISGPNNHPHGGSGGYLGLILGGVTCDETGNLLYSERNAWGNSGGGACSNMCLDKRYLKRAAQAIADGNPLEAMIQVDSVLCSANITDMPNPVWPCYECQSFSNSRRFRWEGCEHFPEGPIGLCGRHAETFTSWGAGERACVQCLEKKGKQVLKPSPPVDDLRSAVRELGGIAQAAGLSLRGLDQLLEGREAREMPDLTAAGAAGLLESEVYERIVSTSTPRVRYTYTAPDERVIAYGVPPDNLRESFMAFREDSRRRWAARPSFEVRSRPNVRITVDEEASDEQDT